MSILIKGMEMPNNCPSCPFLVKNWYDTEFRCLVRKEYIKVNLNTGFDDDCPLVPVAPHGDLIDRDALRKDWLENYKYALTRSILDSFASATTIIQASR